MLPCPFAPFIDFTMSVCPFYRGYHVSLRLKFAWLLVLTPLGLGKGSVHDNKMKIIIVWSLTIPRRTLPPPHSGPKLGVKWNLLPPTGGPVVGHISQHLIHNNNNVQIMWIAFKPLKFLEVCSISSVPGARSVPDKAALLVLSAFSYCSGHVQGLPTNPLRLQTFLPLLRHLKTNEQEHVRCTPGLSTLTIGRNLTICRGLTVPVYLNKSLK